MIDWKIGLFYDVEWYNQNSFSYLLKFQINSVQAYSDEVEIMLTMNHYGTLQGCKHIFRIEGNFLNHRVTECKDQREL